MIYDLWLMVYDSWFMVCGVHHAVLHGEDLALQADILRTRLPLLGV